MRAIIFDLDGTLVDSLPDIAAAVNHVLQGRGLAPLSLAQLKPMVGDGAQILLKLALAVYGQPAGPADLAVFNLYYTAHAADFSAPYPGISQLLAGLQAAGRRLGVCTNKPLKPAQAVLASLGLAGYFQVVIGGDSTPTRKPDPLHLQAVLTALGADHAIMVGDHHNDMAAANGLGQPAIFVSWGYGQAESPYIAHHPHEITALAEFLG